MRRTNQQRRFWRLFRCSSFWRCLWRPVVHARPCRMLHRKKGAAAADNSADTSAAAETNTESVADTSGERNTNTEFNGTYNEAPMLKRWLLPVIFLPSKIACRPSR
ncbi:MAG: hypothetical protein R2867_06720 [Caldilineaceae bacterium]